MKRMAIKSILARNNVQILGNPAGRPIIFGQGLGGTRRIWSGMIGSKGLQSEELSQQIREWLA